MSAIDWHLIKQPLLVCVVLLLILGGGAAYSAYHYYENHALYHRIFIDHSEALTRDQRAEDDAALFQTYRTRFLNYVNQGVIGQEKRLSWAEVLHKQDAALNLSNFTSSISPRRLTAVDHHAPASVQWYTSEQTIQAQLLHEGDLLTILAALESDADGLFKVSACQLKKAKTIQLLPQSDNVSAICQLRWYSMELSHAQG